MVNSLPLSTEPAGTRHLAPSGDPGRHLQLIQCSASELMPYCVQLLLNCLRVSNAANSCPHLHPNPLTIFFLQYYGFSRNLGKIQDCRLPALGYCLLLLKILDPPLVTHSRLIQPVTNDTGLNVLGHTQALPMCVTSKYDKPNRSTLGKTAPAFPTSS